MPFNGAGAYTPPGTDFPAVANTLIESAKFNNVINDIATALSSVLVKDGQQIPTANLPMGGFKLTNHGSGTARSDSANVGNIQDSGHHWGGTAGGTANAITFTLTPAITAYVAGQVFRFKANATNTGPVTVAINGLATKAIQENGAALAGAEILQNGIYELIYDGTQFQLAAVTIPQWSTGDVKPGIKTVADSGWILFDDGTIGSAASGATTRANADTEALFTLLWNNTANADCAVSGGRGGSAAADFAANKTIALPKAKGRALGCFGTGAGLTARAMAAAAGSENAIVVTHSHGGATGTVSADHTHSFGTSSDGSHGHQFDFRSSTGSPNSPDARLSFGAGAGFVLEATSDAADRTATASVIAAGTHSHTGTTGGISANHTHAISAEGSSGTGANVAPIVFLNWQLKL